MLKRKIYNDLIAWKKRKHHPLILSGLRQTGKTYIVKKFGEDNYSNVIYIDLRSNIKIHECFNGDFNVDDMVLNISASIPNTNFVAHDTLLIFDEIQDCPNARSSLKYWDIDGRYDVIATGSFLGVKGFRNTYTRGIPVGYEEFMIMYPLSFYEFLDNLQINKTVIDKVSQCIKESKPIDQAIHNNLKNYYYQYLIVGGMPEAVNTYFENHDLNSVKRIQKSIIESISNEFGRYVDNKGNSKINETLKLRAEACLNSLPAQLSKEYKKFQYSLVDCKGHSPEKEDGLQYLIDLGLVIKVNNIREISHPLKAQVLNNDFKIYIIDTGLLICMLDDISLSDILNGNLSAYKGAITENMLASAFQINDKNTYYYRHSTGSPELDFVFSYKEEETIVECKSTNNRATSMKFVIEHPKRFGVHKCIKISDTNIGRGNGYGTYPIYSIEFLLNNE